MIVLCGTNRPGANTRRVAQHTFKLLSQSLAKSGSPQLSAKLLDLADLKPDIFLTDSYASKPQWFIETFQSSIFAAKGMIVCVPEYNGGFPGVMKYFLDMLKFPESLVGLPVAFIGVAAGQFGALRPVEQLEMIFHYRKAHIFGERLFLPQIDSVLGPQGEGSGVPNGLGQHEERLQTLIDSFIHFVQGLRSSQ